MNEVHETYKPLHPEVPENWSTASLTSANQPAPDIRCKMQRLEGFKGKRLAELTVAAELVSLIGRSQKTDRYRGSPKSLLLRQAA